MNQATNVTEINIIPVKPKDGLLGFCNFVIDQKFYIGSVAIFSKKEGGIRLVYPRRGEIDCCHPIQKEAGDHITNVIEQYFNNLMNHTYEHSSTNQRLLR